MKHLLAIFLLFGTTFSIATELNISNVRSVNRGDVLNTPMGVIFDISWKNSWKNNKNYDAIWVFVKFSGYYNNHAKIAKTGARVLLERNRESAQPTIEVAKESSGFFIYPGKSFRGDINLKVFVEFDTAQSTPSRAQMTGLSVHGIEMVYIPQGPYTLGSPDEQAISRAAFYKSDSKGDKKALYQVNSEKEIQVGPKDDALYYWSEREIYNGDQKGPVPENFPKGFDPFYIMKYELSQQQYVDFLNRIPDNWTYVRSPIGGKGYHEKRGGIYFINGKYVAESPDRPMNYVSFMDGLAYSDWAGLRPITELEFEKASRGPSKPIAAEFVWGTNSYARLERYVSEYSETVTTNGFDEKDLSDETRDIFGASYFWVMDLSGSVWEKVISIGNPVGRKFEGSHGDGKLDGFGNATNPDWPNSDNEIGGFGYRGGGYYEIGIPYGDFNPHSPIGYRYYGAWSGGPRYIAYGYRAGRSAY